MRSGSAACSSAATRCRCEDPPAAWPRRPPIPRRSTSSFAPGLTVVRGPNEAGKSTIQRALELAITRRATSTAVELEAIRPWGAAAGRPLGHRHRVRAGRGGRPEDRHAREDVRGREGHRQARIRRPDDHRPDPRRPGARGADRDPDRGVLPLDRVGPPPRARATCRATRAPCAIGSRRRSAAPTAAPAGPRRSSSGRSTS